MEPKIYLMSDIHGDFRPVRDFWLRAKLKEKMTLNKEDQVLIITGDFGANFFFNYRDENFKEKLGKYPFTYFVIRGNHEERPENCAKKYPDKWHIETYFDNHVWVENDYPYIKYAWDYPLQYTINEKYFTLVFPGAYSVDKYHRLQMGWSWFENEQLDDGEMELGRELIRHHKKCDLVLSHTCPIIYEPTDLFLSCVDQSMVDKSMERYLGEIEYNLDYRVWCWGHYHQHREYPSPDGRRRLMLMHEAVRLEDVMEAKGYVETL
jgi:3-oxoacid CoA-transferase subunit A